jgi:hypothetical protein
VSTSDWNPAILANIKPNQATACFMFAKEGKCLEINGGCCLSMYKKMERVKRFELSTSTLARLLRIVVNSAV